MESLENNEAIINWTRIENSLDDIEPVSGGFSDAQRGIVTIDDKKLFVKIGTNGHTKNWAKKEIEVYKYLNIEKYPFCPNLVSTNDASDGFAIDALLPEDDWDWTNKWTENRLIKTLEAMDELSKLNPSDVSMLEGGPRVTEDDNGWVKILESEKQQNHLRPLLSDSDSDILEKLREEVSKSKRYDIKEDTLCHNDMRADNCAWNEKQQTVKIVDWNWLQYGDRDIDIASFLVGVHQNGLDVREVCPEHINHNAFHWMAGYWLNEASKPIWPGGPENLRSIQLKSAITAFNLSK